MAIAIPNWYEFEVRNFILSVTEQTLIEFQKITTKKLKTISKDEDQNRAASLPEGMYWNENFEGEGGHPSRATGLEYRAEALSGNCCQKWRARIPVPRYQPRTFREGGGIFCTWACEGYAPPRFFSWLSRIGSRFVHFLDQSVLFCLVMSNYFVAPRIVAQTRFFPDSPLLIKVSLRFPPSAM